MYPWFREAFLSGWQLAALLALLLLSSCGGGDGEAAAPPPEVVPEAPVTALVQGVIRAAPYNQVDTSVNDPHAPLVDHSGFDDAQPIGNPVRLGGFVTRLPTGEEGDTFAAEANRFDTYRVTMAAGQRATLFVSDFAAGQNEVDLLLRDVLRTDDNGLPLVVGSSVGAVSIQQVTAPEDGEYFLEVQAFLGSSKYILVVGAMSSLQAMGYPEPLHPHLEMVPGEVIVTLREEASSPKVSSTAGDIMTSGRELADVLGMQMAGGGPGREILLSSADLQASTAALGRQLGAELPERAARAQAETQQEPAAETVRLARALSAHPAVAHVSLNYLYRLQLLPNDTHFELQWHYPLVNLPAAWEIGTGTGDTVVAVLDTGVFLAHPDLVPNLTTTGAGGGDGWNFVDCAPPQDCSNPDDPGDGILPGTSSWHGTHVAGTVAAVTDNDTGVAGSGWSVSLMPVRVCGEGGICSSFDVLQGVRYAAGLANDSGTVPQQPADVINLSISSPTASSAEAALYQQVCDLGIIVVAAAGNSHSDIPNYPASYPCVLSVSALDARSGLAPYSNFGPTIDLAAPGGDMSVDLFGDGYPDGVLSTYVDDRSGSREPAYGFLQGTSMAAPHVSGVMGLMHSLNPEITPALVRSWLQTGLLTEPLGGVEAGTHSLDFGFGRLDALDAMQQAQAEPTPVLVASPSRLGFDAVTGPLPFILESAGGSLSVASVTVTADWISVSPLEVDSAGLGTYLVQADAGSLSPGSYNGRVVAEADNGTTVAVLVSLRVPDPTLTTIPSAGVQYVLLVDPETFETRFQTVVFPQNGEYPFALEATPGSYFLMAGSDLDNDELICTPGESCGAYAHLEQLQLIDLGADGLDGIEFVTNFGAIVDDALTLQKERLLSGGRQADRSPDVKRTDGPDALRRLPGAVLP